MLKHQTKVLRTGISLSPGDFDPQSERNTVPEHRLVSGCCSVAGLRFVCLGRQPSIACRQPTGNKMHTTAYGVQKAYLIC